MMIKIKQTILVLALLMGVGGFLISPTAYAVNTCNDVSTSVIPCDAADKGVEGLLQLVINILTAGVGVAAVGGIIYASILYASAGDSSEQTKKAISIIINVVIGLVAYALMYVLLNFLIPGGVFPSGRTTF